MQGAWGLRPAHKGALNQSLGSCHSLCLPLRFSNSRLVREKLQSAGSCIHASSVADGAGASRSAADSAPGSPARLQRKLSMKQRWRVFKYEWQERRDKASEAVMATPPAQAVAAAWSRLLVVLSPLFAFFDTLQRFWQQTVAAFYDFTMEETKRKWKWERMHEHHFTFWTSALKCLVVLTWTVFFEIVTPPIFIWAIPLPVFCLWAMYDEPEGYAIALALIATLPLKFFPGSGWRWLF
ncbi:hypothetical protein WJX74_005340 [Apatococcus lobatus]|uniref:Uncharacterized protein n=1 Tax=Apatococcus lobatus TaxID=904363 RepID=A0AAW1RSA2_9CHLO